MKLFLIILAALVTCALGLYTVNLWSSAGQYSKPANQSFLSL